MTSITIREVPEETVTELATRAKASGRSMQEYLRLRLIELAARPDLETWLGATRARARTLGTQVSASEILHARDADPR